MIHFFRDVLDGPIYLIVVVVSIIMIIAIIGFIFEKKKAEKDEKEKRVTISNATPIEPVRTREVVLSTKEELPQVENIQQIPNPMTDQEQKEETTLTIDSSTVNVEETPVDTKSEPAKVEDVVQVIDFGTTEDIKIDYTPQDPEEDLEKTQIFTAIADIDEQPQEEPEVTNQEVPDQTEENIEVNSTSNEETSDIKEEQPITVEEQNQDIEESNNNEKTVNITDTASNEDTNEETVDIKEESTITVDEQNVEESTNVEETTEVNDIVANMDINEETANIKEESTITVDEQNVEESTNNEEIVETSELVTEEVKEEISSNQEEDEILGLTQEIPTTTDTIQETENNITSEIPAVNVEEVIIDNPSIDSTEDKNVVEVVDLDVTEEPQEENSSDQDETEILGITQEIPKQKINPKKDKTVTVDSKQIIIEEPIEDTEEELIEAKDNVEVVDQKKIKNTKIETL